MNYSKIIDTVNAEGIKLLARKFNLKVKFTKTSDLLQGPQVVCIIEVNNIDKFLLFSRHLKGLNENPHLFSNIYVDYSGVIKRIKRRFKKGVFYNDVKYYSITELKKTGLSRESKKRIIRKILS